jgi:hypothetical protein
MGMGVGGVDQLEIVADAILGGLGAILGVAGTVAALTALMFLLGSIRAMRRSEGYLRYKDHPHGGHGHGGHGPNLEFELGQIAEKLDRITAAVDPKGWGLLRRMASNVFWSVFGVVAGIVIQALWAPQTSYY